MGDYFKVIDNREYCAAFKVYPSGFPVTSSTHAVDNTNNLKTMCGLTIKSSIDQWYYDEWGNGIECRKCNKKLGL